MQPAGQGAERGRGDPASVYQANTSVLVRSVTTCESAACSIGRNGPTSCPLGLMTPMVPATTSSPDRGGGEDEPGRRHQQRADDQHAAAAEAIGARGEKQRDDRVADERQRQQQAGLRLAQADADQVEHQHDRERAVREQADEPGGEQQPAVARQRCRRSAGEAECTRRPRISSDGGVSAHITRNAVPLKPRKPGLYGSMVLVSSCRAARLARDT